MLIQVVVWLKIREHDITIAFKNVSQTVVVWLKIREHDIDDHLLNAALFVVVWLKIREHDILIYFYIVFV